MDFPLVDTVLLALLVACSLWAVMTPTLLRSVIGLGLTSVVVTIIMFRLEAPWAAVFELSVCAGLISAIFIGTISLTQPDREPELRERRRERIRRYWYLPVLVLLVAVALLGVRLPALALGPAAPEEQVRHLLWNVRQLDLLGQVVILLAGALGVVALFRPGRQDVG